MGGKWPHDHYVCYQQGRKYQVGDLFSQINESNIVKSSIFYWYICGQEDVTQGQNHAVESLPFYKLMIQLTE